MEQRIKKTVAHFLKIDEALIHDGTVIEIKGSIMVHRMYAILQKEVNFPIKGYDKIKTYGDLLAACQLKPSENISRDEPKVLKDIKPSEQQGLTAGTASKMFSVGIDLEEVGSMPQAADFREDAFYKQNFSQKEISYCLLQPAPLQSFAGKFAAKEAIVKADNSYKQFSFSQIEIGNDISGAPFCKDFSLSISHTDKYVVAVALKLAL